MAALQIPQIPKEIVLNPSDIPFFIPFIVLVVFLSANYSTARIIVLRRSIWRLLLIWRTN